MQDDSRAESPDWLSVLSRLEQRVEYLTAQLQELRQSVSALVVTSADASAPAPARPEQGDHEEPAFSISLVPATTFAGHQGPPPPNQEPVPEPQAIFQEAAREEFHAEQTFAAGNYPETQAYRAEAESPEPRDAQPQSESRAQPDAGEDDEARREAVRRAVEAARAELGLEPPDTGARLYELWRTSQIRGATGELSAPELPAVVPAEEPAGTAQIIELSQVRTLDPQRVAAAAEKWQAARAEPVPLSIVIEDEVRRIELVRVFDTLRRVNCAEQAALLNYSPHSVTVALPPRLDVPDTVDLEEAARAAFGRDCEVVSDGMRVAVRLLDWRRAGRALTP